MRRKNAMPFTTGELADILHYREDLGWSFRRIGRELCRHNAVVCKAYNRERDSPGIRERKDRMYPPKKEGTLSRLVGWLLS